MRLLCSREKIIDYHIIERTLGHEVVLGYTDTRMYSLVCFMEDLRKEMREFRGVGLLEVEIYAILLWCNERRRISNDVDLLEVFNE